jgi:hypothetical protein
VLALPIVVTRSCCAASGSHNHTCHFHSCHSFRRGGRLHAAGRDPAPAGRWPQHHLPGHSLWRAAQGQGQAAAAAAAGRGGRSGSSRQGLPRPPAALLQVRTCRAQLARAALRCGRSEPLLLNSPPLLLSLLPHLLLLLPLLRCRRARTWRVCACVRVCVCVCVRVCVCARPPHSEMGARFISYDAAEGTWLFEVRMWRAPLLAWPTQPACAPRALLLPPGLARHGALRASR